MGLRMRNGEYRQVLLELRQARARRRVDLLVRCDELRQPGWLLRHGWLRQRGWLALAAVATADLDLVGIALHAGRKEVDKMMEGLAPHP